MIRVDNKYNLYAYILFAYLISLLFRMIWVYQFSAYDPFYWHGQLMINTNDGYFFASGVKNIFDNSMEYNQRVPGFEYGLVAFVYFLAKILPFSIDSIILYLPAVISSLVVIPIILTLNLYGKPLLGFLASILASITWSYYNRTMVGYFDTDLFALVFPVFIVYYLIASIKNNSLFDILVASLLTQVYFYAYDASLPIIFALAMGYMMYLVVFFKKEENFFHFLTLFTISSINFDWKIRAISAIVLFCVFYKNLLKDKKYQFLIAIAVAVSFFYFNNVFSVIYGKISEYINTGVAQSSALKFFEVHQTIREAGKIPFEIFADRISGSVFSFIIAAAGYILLIYRQKEFLLFLPLVGIGFFAYIGGLRFTVYAVPAMAIGAVYFFHFIFSRLFESKRIQYAGVTLATVALLYPNIKHIIGYRVPTVFNKEEVKVLDQLKNIASAKDYTLTWWDYGYPIWYYSNTNTLIDGGKHNADNYIISKILTTDSQALAANLARVSVEIYTKNHLGNSPVLEKLFVKDGKALDVDSILDKMRFDNYPLPKKTRDIYLYLPYRMLNIFPTIVLFSNLDLNSGKQYKQPIFYVSRNFHEQGNKIFLGSGVIFDRSSGALILGNKKVILHHFSIVGYGKDGRVEKQDKVLSMESNINLIYMRNYHTFLVLDDRMYNSTYIQLFIFENYDSSLFEPVIMSPYAKVYKLKR